MKQGITNESNNIAENALLHSVEGSIDISIIIPHYQSAELCINTIASVSTINNTCEIIIIDDDSAMAHYQKLKDQLIHGKFNGIQVRLLRLNQNKGSYYTRLIATKYAMGRYIKFLDQDDLLIEGTLDAELKEAESTCADIVMSNWFEAWGQFEKKQYVQKSERHHKAPIYSQPTLDFIEKGGVYTSAALYRKKLFNSIQPITDWKPLLNDDWVIFGQALLKSTRFTTLNENAYVWRHHNSQLSSDKPLGHSSEFYHFMLWYIAQLKDSSRLSTAHKSAMANYLTKNAVSLCWLSKPRWIEVASIIKSLEPKLNTSPYWGKALNALCSVIGIKNSVIIYVQLKRLINKNSFNDKINE